VASSKITVNAISPHLIKKFTIATYRIGIGRVRCLWKALVKYHSVPSKKNNNKKKTQYSQPKTRKTKIWFQGILGVKIQIYSNIFNIELSCKG
jgi:hypothetical protein